MTCLFVKSSLLVEMSKYNTSPDKASSIGGEPSQNY